MHRSGPRVALRVGGHTVDRRFFRAGDKEYRRLPVEYTLGPDLGSLAHGLWPTIELHAEALEKICRQQARVTLRPRDEDGSVLKGESSPGGAGRCDRDRDSG